MSIFNGIANIRRLEPETQGKFEDFYQAQVEQSLIPVILDFTLIAMLINGVSNIALQFNIANSWSSVHPLAYLYLGSFIALGLAHRFSHLRSRAQLSLYFIFLLTAVFAYRDFIIEQGWLSPLYGLFFFLAFLGYISLSLKHTLALLSINTLLLFCAHSLVYGIEATPIKISELLSNPFIFACIMSSIASVFFARWLFRNLLAMQFLLKHNNQQLKDTFSTLKSTEQQLIQQQKYQALNHMAKGLLHEVINPLNSASQALSYAQSVNEDEDVGEALDEALTQQQRISDIIYDLRSFAQPDIKQNIENLSVAKLVNKAIKFCQREFKQTQTKVEVYIPEDLTLECQPSAMTQVFVNLLLNASDALSKVSDERSRKIVVSCDEQAEQLAICFKDNGIGIDEADIARISDPFVSKQEAPEKMGLGLSICQTILRHHGGSMNIESEPGAWTEVRLSLPAVIEISDTMTGKHNYSERKATQKEII